MEQENQALRGELSALDPEFFEEIEDLKWDHHQLKQRAVQYEGLIANLAAELGRAPPAGMGTAVGGVASEQLPAAAVGRQWLLATHATTASCCTRCVITGSSRGT